jgi:Fe-S-cluster-containing dehydrogenase component/CRP-like cAMP-binding protein
MPAFEAVQPDQFPDWLKLEDLIANEGRISIFDRGDVILRKGDYGNSLFVILSGSIVGLTDQGEDETGQGRKKAGKSMVDAFAQLLTGHHPPEFRRARDRTPAGKGRSGSAGESLNEFEGVRQVDIDTIAERKSAFSLRAPHMFGELAALTRSPRSAHVFAAEDGTTLFELSWQGLRDIRNWSDDFRSHIDMLYSERGLATRLRECPLFNHVDDDTLDEIAKECLFETYGDFDWAHHFQRAIGQQAGAEKIITQEPLICNEGDHVDGLLIVNNGFARVSEHVDKGERTIGYLSRNDVIGLEAMVTAADGKQAPVLDVTLRAIGYVDVIRVPTYLVQERLLPGLGNRDLHRALNKGKTGPASEVRQGMMDFLVDHRFINGEQAMVVNLDRCVGCDDCVRACAVAHNNNPRFVRDGPVYENVMIASACMHCTDPVCLIGCPTGAIHRAPVTGNVVINDNTCIGCATCANACPYNNIKMVEIRGQEGDHVVDLEGKTIARATKCDFCDDQLTGPACVQACPHDALVRQNLRDTDSLVKWLG